MLLKQESLLLIPFSKTVLSIECKFSRSKKQKGALVWVQTRAWHTFTYYKSDMLTTALCYPSILTSGLTEENSSFCSGGGPEGNGILCTRERTCCNLLSEMCKLNNGNSPWTFILKKTSNTSEYNRLERGFTKKSMICYIPFSTGTKTPQKIFYIH